MIRFDSIISRIVILHVIAVAITSVLMSVALSWLLNMATNNIHNDAMEEQAVSLAAHLVLEPDGRLSLVLPPNLQGFYSQPYGRYSYAVIDDTGKTLFSSLVNNAPILPPIRARARCSSWRPARAEAAISGASVRRNVGGKTVWVQAAEDLANSDVLIDDIVEDFYRHVGWITLPILLVLLVIDIAIFRRALLPLRQASEIAQHITPARTDIRLPLQEIPTEVRPLVSAINKALDRLDEGFRLQREFTADAAHELRTPLSILRTRVETLDNPGIAQALRQDIEAMSRVVGQLLDIAELEAFAIDPARSPICKPQAPKSRASSRRSRSNRAGKSRCSAQPRRCLVKGNAEMIKRAIRNLAENAIRHAPKDTVVEFVVEDNGTVTVQDRGPGISDEERELIFRRFWRRDRNSQGSSGLGLSIVQRIAELHGAGIEVERRVMGGAQFSLHFIKAAPYPEA